jgi:hypothetical protein
MLFSSGSSFGIFFFSSSVNIHSNFVATHEQGLKSRLHHDFLYRKNYNQILSVKKYVVIATIKVAKAVLKTSQCKLES